MTRDEGPPEDEVLGHEPRSPDELARYREHSVKQGDAHDSQARPSTSNKRRARGTNYDAPDPYTKPEAWIDAFNAQCTKDLTQSLYRYAARLLSGARKVSSDSAAAMELVQTAIHGMLDGPDHWDFVRQKLSVYLKNSIKRQILANLERADRLPHVSLDELTAAGQSPESDELERALRDHRPDRGDVEDAWSAIDLLCRRAVGDGDVIALILALADDRTSRADVMEVTGFSPQRYRAAMRRLNRMADEVGIELDHIDNGKEQT